MPTVTINIAGPGTQTSDGGSSFQGHMWYSIDDGNGTVTSYGFSPNEYNTGKPFAPGKTNAHGYDDNYYLNRDYTRTIEITQEQYDVLKNFGDTPKAYGFNTYYNALSNSCIDFVWDALKEAGLKPPPGNDDWDGDLLPLDNADNVDDIYNPYVPGEQEDWILLTDENGNPILDEDGTPIYGPPEPYYPPGWPCGEDAPGSDIPGQIRPPFDDAENMAFDPLVLDLDGDGVETLGKDAGVHFDHDGNGFAELTGWAGKDDGLLVFDRNGDGRVNDGSELFGNNTRLENGQLASNGFAALADLDHNHDGKIDAQDEAFAQLRVWKDANSNGQVDANELLTLEDAGVASLATHYTHQSQTDEYGNSILQQGSYTDTNGNVREMHDIWFGVDTAYTVDKNPVYIPLAIAGLPEIRGSGNVANLHQAMARDQSGQLKALVESFASSSDKQEQASILDQILFVWTRSDEYAANSRGSHMDGRKLYVLEAFLGEAFQQGNHNANPDANGAARLMQAYNTLGDYVSAQLLAQTQFKPLYELVSFTLDAETGQYDPDVSSLLEYMQQRFEQDAAATQQFMNGFAENLLCLRNESAESVFSLLRQAGNLEGTPFEAALVVSTYNIISGDAGNNTLTGNKGDDLLHGYVGNDRLYGGDDNDYLIGGEGNDNLQGEKGNDTYYFARGDGQDTIYDYDTTAGNVDAIEFAEDITAADILARRSGSNLVLNLQGATDKITVSNFFSNTAYEIEEVRFADGTSWDRAEIDRQVTAGTDGNDALEVTGNERDISGGAGNDTLYGASDADTLRGDGGNDTLYGDGVCRADCTTTFHKVKFSFIIQ